MYYPEYPESILRINGLGVLLANHSGQLPYIRNENKLV